MLRLAQHTMPLQVPGATVGFERLLKLGMLLNSHLQLIVLRGGRLLVLSLQSDELCLVGLRRLGSLCLQPLHLALELAIVGDRLITQLAGFRDPANRPWWLRSEVSSQTPEEKKKNTLRSDPTIS